MCYIKPGIKVIEKCKTVSLSVLIVGVANEKDGIFIYSV